jgi:hypothetical protein
MPIPLGIFATAGASAASAGAYELISTTILTGDNNSIVFSSIPQTYKHLQVRVVSKTKDTGLGLYGVRLNGVTSNSYSYHRLGTNSTGASVISQNTINTSWGPGYLYQPLNTTSGVFSASIIDILDYTSTTNNKTVRALNGSHDPSGDKRVGLHSGNLRSTSAVTSVTVEDMVWTFVSGSRFSLYGIKG